jgi:hypothetical protein
MKNLLLILFVVSVASGFGQVPSPVAPDATVERVDISGVPETRLSTELRGDIQKLVGQTYNADAARQLADGIQIELPEYVAAVTTQPGSQPDRVRIVLVVAKIADNDALKTNINSRYIVDAVEIGGTFKAKISDSLNTDLQGMVGKNLDNTRADELRDRIVKENGSDEVYVSRKLRRGSSPQHVKIVYEVEKAANSIGFSASTGGVYHSRQGFSIPDLKFSAEWSEIPGRIWGQIENDPHPLIERYAGWTGGVSLRSKPARFDVSYSSFRAQWKENTLQADAQSGDSPGLYRLRDTVATSLTASLPLRLSAMGGVDFVELQMQTPTLGFQKANAVKGSLSSLNIRQTESGSGSHSFEWMYEIRSGTKSLDSDFVYTRHEWNAGYWYRRDSKPVFHASFLAGRATGTAPMFERFSLGNATTLRGWNKYEINPLGGNRVVHGSAEYTYKFLTGFYDVGSVWTAGQPGTTRHSVGFRLGWNAGCTDNPFCLFSLTVGFPLNGPQRPAFIVGM